MGTEAEIDLKRNGFGSVQRYGTSHLGEKRDEQL